MNIFTNTLKRAATTVVVFALEPVMAHRGSSDTSTAVDSALAGLGEGIKIRADVTGRVGLLAGLASNPVLAVTAASLVLTHAYRQERKACAN